MTAVQTPSGPVRTQQVLSKDLLDKPETRLCSGVWHHGTMYVQKVIQQTFAECLLREVLGRWGREDLVAALSQRW